MCSEIATSIKLIIANIGNDVIKLDPSHVFTNVKLLIYFYKHPSEWKDLKNSWEFITHLIWIPRQSQNISKDKSGKKVLLGVQDSYWARSVMKKISGIKQIFYVFM